MGVDVIIPVYRPDKKLEKQFCALLEQSVPPDHIIMMVTETEGAGCAEVSARLQKTLAKHKLYRKKKVAVTLVPVRKEEFDHGGTRRQAVKLSHADYFLMMTQDAVPADDYLIERLLLAVQKEKCGIAYARQCASVHSSMVEQYTRLFNYPTKSCVKTKADLPKLGIKTYFCSDVCAMYKRSVYDAVGGFVERAIFNEDMLIAAAMLEQDYSIAYVAEARVHHTHDYSLREQFMRNFDLGVSHAQHREVFAAVPAEGEGKRLVKGAVEYLLGQHRYMDVLDLLFQSAAKYLGYRLGRGYFLLPKQLVLTCAQNKAYFETHELTKRKKDLG